MASDSQTNKFQRQDTATLPNSNIINIIPSRNGCIYTPFYCEENVWKMCQDVATRLPSELPHIYAVFVSNKSRAVPLWRQKAGQTEDKLVIWVFDLAVLSYRVTQDYHALLLYHPPKERCVVYDLDSDLPFPTHFHKYVTETFRTDQVLKPEHFRYFRVVPGEQFLANFASDRRHMKNADGSYEKAPPAHSPISTPTCSHNLDQYMDMDQGKGPGEVLNLTELVKRFYQPTSSS